MDVSLKIERNVAACCDPESTRYALGNVRLHDQGGQVLATATNGKCLTVCPLEGTIDAPCLMPAGAVPTVKAGGAGYWEWGMANPDWQTGYQGTYHGRGRRGAVSEDTASLAGEGPCRPHYRPGPPIACQHGGSTDQRGLEGTLTCNPGGFRRPHQSHWNPWNRRTYANGKGRGFTNRVRLRYSRRRLRRSRLTSRRCPW